MTFNQNSGLSVIVIGATGCIGSELIKHLPNILPIRKLSLYASKKREGDVIEVGDNNIRIQALSPEGVAADTIDDADVVFFTCPPSLVKMYSEPFIEEGIAIFDLTGALIGPVGFSLYGIANNEENFAEKRICVLPSPVGASLARVYYALQGLGLWLLQSSNSVSASIFGQKGIEELSQQVSALFMGRETKKQLFPTGLAFDILPMVGQIQEDGVTSAERRVDLEVATLLGVRKDAVRTTLNLAPIFCGVVSNTYLYFEDEVSMDSIISEFEDDNHLSWNSIPPSVKSIIGQSSIFVGRLRSNPLGRGFELWVCCDNVSVAVHNTLEMAKYYHSIDLL
jgi:aspartate-semialdehyde dehydrogenase